MSVTLKQLTRFNVQGKELEVIIREHLQIIDDKLLKSDRVWGRNMITHELPISILIAGIDKKNIQRIIYSSILKSLESRGFDARIVLEHERTILYITWTSDICSEEIDAMNTIIRKKRIDRSELEKTFSRENKSDNSNKTSNKVNSQKSYTDSTSILTYQGESNRNRR